MNFLAHARNSLDSPYHLVGCCLPDWLRHLRPRIRVLEHDLVGFLEKNRGSEPRSAPVAEVAGGMLCHLRDDDSFHANPHFTRLLREFTHSLREGWGDQIPKPGFVSHLAVELCLDAELMRIDPNLGPAFYDMLDSVPPAEYERVGTELFKAMLGREASGLARTIERFSKARYILDYASDSGLLYRLEQIVVHALSQPPLPASLIEIVPSLRKMVAAARPALLGLET